MLDRIMWEEICRAMAALCLGLTLATVAGAVVLLVREGLADKLRNALLSKHSRRVSLLAVLAVGVWILVIGQNVSAAEAPEISATEATALEIEVAESDATEAAAAEIETIEEGTTEAATTETEAATTEIADTDATEAAAIEPETPENPEIPEDPETPDEPQQPEDPYAPTIQFQMTEEVSEDAEGNIYCRSDNAGICIVFEESREEDSGITAYRVVVTDCKGNEIRREWENPETEPAENPSEDPGEQQDNRIERKEKLISTEEIAALSDGMITVKAEAEDAAGNRGEGEFGYVLDTEAPVAEIRYMSAADGYLYEEGGMEAYFSADVEVALRVWDGGAGLEVPLDEELYGFLMWEGGAETAQETGAAEPIEFPGNETSITTDCRMRFGAYGRDRAGNPLTVREVMGSTIYVSGSTDDWTKKNAPFTLTEDVTGQGAPAVCRPGATIVRDTVCPVLTTAISLPIGNPSAIDRGSGLIYYGKNADQYGGGAPSITAAFTIIDQNIDPGRILPLIAYAQVPEGRNCEEIMPEQAEEVGAGCSWGAQAAENGPASTLTLQIVRHPAQDDTPDGVYRFGVQGTDQAGNPLKLGSGGAEDTGNSGAEDTGNSGAEGTGNSGAEGIGNSGVEGTGNSGAEDAGSSEAEPEHEDELYGVVCEDAARGVFLTGRKVVDTVAPVGGLSFENNAGNVYYRVEQHGDVWVTDREGFMPYRRETDAVIRWNAADTSPVSVSCRIRSTAGSSSSAAGGGSSTAGGGSSTAGSSSSAAGSGSSAAESGNDPAPDGTLYRHRCNTQAAIHGEQVLRLEDVVFRDRAGNESAGLGRTVNLYFDIRLPEADIDAPSASVRAVSSITARSADGQPLYGGQVTLEVTAEDPGREAGASGLREVRYDVLLDGKTLTSAATLFRGEDASADPDAENRPVYRYSGRITIPSGGQWESNDIVVRVAAEDNAGNLSDPREGGIIRFGIDTTSPEVTVVYDNNEVRNGMYFDRERTARIAVRERNFDAGTLIVSAPGAQVGTWRRMRGSADAWRQPGNGTGSADAWQQPGNGTGGADAWQQLGGGTSSADVWQQLGGTGDADIWIMEVRFPADGAYTLDVGGADALGNPAVVRYAGEAPRAFVIDATPPRIEVFWDNNDVRNGRYYNRERVATIRITDLSFDEDRVKIVPRSTGFRLVDGRRAAAGTALAAVVYEMELPYTGEGEWALQCTCMDLAGNTAVPVSEAPFVLDWTAPRLCFDKGTVREAAAYADEISPVLRWEEENPSPAACYVVWSNVSAGGRTMECRGGDPTGSVSAAEGDAGIAVKSAGSIALPDLMRERASDGVCVLLGTACDLAGNRVFVRRNLSVNRFGSLYDLTEDAGTLEMIGGYYTSADRPFVVAEYNVSPLIGRQVTLFRNGAGHVLTEGVDYAVAESAGRSGWKYVYRIDPSAFHEEGKYSLLLESDDAAGRHNSSPGRFRRGDLTGRATDNSPEWAVDKTPPAVRIVGSETDQRRFVTDAIEIHLLPEDNMELQSLAVQIRDDKGSILEEYQFEKAELEEILGSNRGEVPVKINASEKWQTMTATAADGAGNYSSGLLGIEEAEGDYSGADHGEQADDAGDAAGADSKQQADAGEQEYRVLVSSNLLVHLYRSGLLPAAAFLALAAVVWIKAKFH